MALVYLVDTNIVSKQARAHPPAHLLQRFPILPYDEEAARWVAEARTSLKGRHRTIEHPDLCIAGIAASRGLVVVTENVKHFTVHAGLRVENWAATPT